MSAGQSTRFAMEYTAQQVTGVSVLVVVSILSFLAVFGLLAAIALSAYNTWHSSDRFLFVRTHGAAYFICLMLCWLLQCVASIMNGRWIEQRGISSGSFCSSQGALKHVADIGVAVWSLVMAANTFNTLVLEWTAPRYVLWAVLAFGWLFVGVVTGAGSALLNIKPQGPFYDVNGVFCWISPEYNLQIITLAYMIILLSVAFSAVLYIMTLLKIRGNLKVIGWKIYFCRATDASDKDADDERLARVAKQLLHFPIAYAVLVFPVALTRLLAWSGLTIPFEVYLFSEAVYVLSGFWSVILFTATRRILPLSSMRLGDWYFAPGVRFSDDPLEKAGLHSQDLAEKGASEVVFIPQSKPVLLRAPASIGRKDFQRPPELVLNTDRDTDFVTVARPLSSHWSPDTPPLQQSTRLSVYLRTFKTAASKI